MYIYFSFIYTGRFYNAAVSTISFMLVQTLSNICLQNPFVINQNYNNTEI